MKKSIIASVLGLAGMLCMVSSSKGQGTVYFANYDFGGGLNAPVTFAASGTDGVTAVTAGEGVGSGFTVSFLYSIDGGTTYFSDAVAQAGGSAYPGSFTYSSPTPDGPVDGLNTGAGYFIVGNVAMPSYASPDALTMIVQAYSGTSYGEVGFWSGESAAFVVPTAAYATGSTPPSGDFGSAMQGFTVSFVPVPEPTTLALAGLGGLASLMAFRRKKA